jgi:energy-coupling factor transporter ATP-binding protein EcfA2
MSIVKAKNLTFCYPGSDESALKEVSFEIHENEVVGIVGPPGAGKTTLGMVIAGLAPSVTGGELRGELDVNINRSQPEDVACNSDLNQRDDHNSDDREDSDKNENIRQIGRVGMVFEEMAAQLVQLKALEEVRVPLLNTGASPDEATDRAWELLNKVGLGNIDDDTRIWDLSGGQQQQLAIAANLAIDPEILIFDNVMDKLDVQGQEQVHRIIKDLSREMTLIIIERNSRILLETVNRLLVLADGKIVTEGSPDEILRNPDLLSCADIEPPMSVHLARALGMSESPLTNEEFLRAYGNGRTQQLELSSLTVSEYKDFLVESQPVEDENGFHNYDNFGKPVVRIQDVSFCYSDKGPRALKDVSITVHEGEVHALIGSSGAGKTTVIKHIAGLVEPRQGKVIVCNKDTRNKNVPEFGLIVGTVLQNPEDQISEKTVKDEIAFPLKHRQKKGTGLFLKEKRYDEDFIENRVSEVCELVGIEEELFDRDPLLLPRGLKKLVTIAEAMVVDPKVLLLDEPTHGLGATALGKIKQTLRRLCQEGKAVVLVSNNINFVAEVADTVTVLNNGRIVVQGPLREVFARNNWGKLARLQIQPPETALLARHFGTTAWTCDELVSQLSSR